MNLDSFHPQILWISVWMGLLAVASHAPSIDLTRIYTGRNPMFL